MTHGEMLPSGDTPGVLIASWNCGCRLATLGEFNRKLLATATNRNNHVMLDGVI
jgi:hypothetical protein